MRVFIEEQRFRQWWIYSVIGILFMGMILALITNPSDEEKITSLLIGLFILSLVIVLISILRLHTRIDNAGITTRFSPFPKSKKHFPWSEIEKCYIRKYSATLEYGGRGLRILKNKKAYSVAGKYGIQIVINNGRHFFIGTQKPMDATNVVNYYKNKAARE